MAKSIILTKNDTGYEFLVTFIDEFTKKPLDLSGKIVNVTIINPSGLKIDEMYGTPTNNVGEASIILTEKHTSLPGTYSSWWQVVTSNSQITSTQGVYYSVLEEFGQS